MGFKSSLSRREALGLLSGATLALATSRLVFAQTASSPSANPVLFGADGSSYSLLTPELTEGPFYIDSERIRRDITEGKPGVPLKLRIKVVHVSTGAPVSGAAVDIWHCDAQGVYSGFTDQGPPPFGNVHPPPFPPGPPPMPDEDGMLPPLPGEGFSPGGFRGPGFGPGHGREPDNRLTFLRGMQLTDTAGMAKIDTVVPGWYVGRATHIHVRVHNGGVVADGRYRKGHISHTGQIFLPVDFTDHIYRLPAYARKSQDRVPLEDDGIFRQSGMQLARIVAVDPGRPQLGYFSDTLLVIDPAATPNPA
jgi:protocatechuate 3,4-dioxygenase beta subunit